MNKATLPTRFAPERFTAFTDAVVAIAMTLLILPLLESVTDAAGRGIQTAEFLRATSGQLISFILSFVLIATFWMEHHQVYRRVTAITPTLLWINIGWLLTIVWLPVPTALLGQLSMDAVQATVYIGTLIMTQVATLTAKLYLLRHRDLADIPLEALRRGCAGDVSAIILFLVALGLAAWVHPIGYLALLLLVLVGPLERGLLRLRR
ncbi:TMEM175 family protein [Microbacterium sp.]|uniref:TMEM175 family protein n=1 Tax=Microbacterium sp. TaxID=51671 RepID=UPI0028B04DFC|nr:TMEM175 family protein [Microbacterium sp.]